eukprot:SAG31_NODE_11494_length_1024_cov_1.181622_1_plen_46_part_10
MSPIVREKTDPATEEDESHDRVRYVVRERSRASWNAVEARAPTKSP